MGPCPPVDDPEPPAEGSEARVVRPTGFEPVAVALEVRCSIQLSYGRVGHKVCG